MSFLYKILKIVKIIFLKSLQISPNGICILQLTPDHPFVRWKHFEALYSADTSISATQLRVCPKLTLGHLELSNTSKIKVRLATQASCRIFFVFKVLFLIYFVIYIYCCRAWLNFQYFSRHHLPSFFIIYFIYSTCRYLATRLRTVYLSTKFVGFLTYMIAKERSIFANALMIHSMLLIAKRRMKDLNRLEMTLK